MLDPWFDHILSGFDAGLLIVLKVTIILLLTRLTLLTMHRAPASIRHLTIALALLSSLTLPLVAWVVPAWDVVPRLASMGINVSDAGQPVDAYLAAETDLRRGPAAPLISEASEPLASGWSRGLKSLGGWLLLAWLLVSGALLALLFARVLANTLAVRRAEPIVDQGWLTLLADTRCQLGVRSSVGLRRRSSRAMPLVWGLVRPAVLLPADCDTWSPARRRAVLTHELGHVSGNCKKSSSRCIKRGRRCSVVKTPPCPMGPTTSYFEGGGEQ